LASAFDMWDQNVKCGNAGMWCDVSMLLLAAIAVTVKWIVLNNVSFFWGGEGGVSEFSLIGSYPKFNLYIFFYIRFNLFLLGLSAKLPVCHIEWS
jgi:hypothetical protein